MEPGSAVTVDSGFERQVCSGNPLKVHFSPEFLHLVRLSDVLRDINDRVQIVKKATSADFLIDVLKNPGLDMGCPHVIFTTTLKNVTDHPFGRLPPMAPDPGRIACVLHPVLLETAS